MNIQQFILLSQILFLHGVNGISLNKFYPFGRHHGDTRAPTNDDGSTSPIQVSSLFPFFNHQHNSLIVNTNGVISFLGTMSAYTPSPFPLASKKRLIAPYWTDIDTRNGGDVWYRESTNSTLLQKASTEIQELFPEQSNFRASWMFIATWSNVAFFGAHEIGSRKRCTFQCLLITNGRHSFTVYLYNKIQWTTGTASGGDRSTGLGGTPAQVGFDAGDGMNFHAVEASRTADIINISRMSNVDVPGKFVFRVDYATIKAGGCNVEGTLTITPREATMLGGTRLIVSGPCFDQTKSIHLTLSDGNSVPCKILTSYSVSCISPQVYRTGKDKVFLKLIQQDDNVFTFVGQLLIVNHGLTRPVIERSPYLWKHDSIVTIKWKPADLRLLGNDTSIRIELYELQRENLNIKVVYHSTITSQSIVSVNSGSYSFRLNFTNKAAIVKVSSSQNGGSYFWSDVFTVQVNIHHSQSICQTWRIRDMNYQAITSNHVNPCPCTLAVAAIDTSRFSIDPICKGSQESRHRCALQPYAQVCYRQNFASRLGYESQCCYNERGLLMNPDDSTTTGSGYVNRFHYLGNKADNIPYLSNFWYDIVPYQHCCVYQAENANSFSSSCSVFYNRRPPNSCSHYVPPRPARVSGDPHFVTFDGHHYTFNPVGEFLAISSGNFLLQLRMEQIRSLPVSSVSAFVARSNPTAEKIEVRANTIRGIDVLVDGSLVDFETAISTVTHVEGATIEKTSDSPPTVFISFPEVDISIKSTSSRNVLTLFIFTSSTAHRGNLRGLFGDNDGDRTNDLQSRENNILNANAPMSSIHHDFGLTWRIKESESMFTYEGGRTYDSYQNLTFVPNFDVPKVTHETAAVCGNNSDCIYDYVATGDRLFGEMSYNASQGFEAVTSIVNTYVTTYPNTTIPTTSQSTYLVTAGATLSTIVNVSSKKSTLISVTSTLAPKVSFSSQLTTRNITTTNSAINTTTNMSIHNTSNQTISSTKTHNAPTLVSHQTTTEKGLDSTKSPTSQSTSQSTTTVYKSTNQDHKGSKLVSTVSSISGNQGLTVINTITITTAAAVLIIGVIIVVIVVTLTMARVYRHIGKINKIRKSKDGERISHVSVSTESVNEHIKRPLVHQDGFKDIEKM